jgi:hypothetical protein
MQQVLTPDHFQIRIGGDSRPEETEFLDSTHLY